MRTAPALVLALAALSPAQAPSGDVAVGVFPFLVGNMDGRIQEIAGNCSARDIDTVYVSVFRAEGARQGTLWVTDTAGDWNPAWGSVRPTGAGIALPSLIAACHAVGVRVVAVLKCFNDNVQPTDLAHRQYLLDVIDYFVDAWQPDGRPVYDLDGIALDYIRFVGSGVGNDPQHVTAFLADVRAHIGGLSLHCYLIANRYTFDGPNYDGQFASYASVLSGLASQFGQHWEQMARHVDVMMPMAYTADGSIYGTYALHQAYVRQTALQARAACANAGFPGRRVCPVVRTYPGGSETTTVSTIDASITGALLGGADGYQSFRYQFLTTTPAWWGPMQQYAVPGCNWPTPALQVAAPDLTAALDPAQSRDNDQPAATLETRFEWSGDGVFDTPWQPLGTAEGLVRHPGSWIGTLQVRDAQGHVSTTRRRFAAGGALALMPPFLSATAGGSVQIALSPGPAAAGGVYLVLGTLSGASPGFTWQPGFPVPINVDFLTVGLAAQPNGGVLQNGLGLFDGTGTATAVLTVPGGLVAPWIGTQVHWSFLAADVAGRPLCAGGSAPMLIFL